MTKTLVKICGLTRTAEVEATAAAGAAYAGFVFFPKSPRYVSIDQARALCLAAPEGLAKVSLTVDMDDAGLDQMLASVPIDILQLHGHESPSRVAAIKARFGLPVMKAVGIADESDLAKIDEYASVADMLLIDAKPPKHADLPGGNGLTFDWRLIAGRKLTLPWMLAGGLTAASVAEAISLTGAAQVDVSTGVESTPGTKDTALIDAFVSAANQTGET